MFVRMVSELGSSYLRCKQDENILSRWMGKNAVRCSWKSANPLQTLIGVPSQAGRTTQEPKAPKPKGIARKLARDAANNDSKEKSPVRVAGPTAQLAPTTSTKYTVDSKTLLEQDEFIANYSTPRVALPDVVFRVAQRAVSV